MNGNISALPMQGSGPLNYFLESLEAGGMCDQTAVRQQLEQGEYSVIAPGDSREARLLRFEEGGLLPAEPAQHIGNGWLQAVPNTIPDVADLVALRTSALVNPLLWTHEALLPETRGRKIDRRTLDGKSYYLWDEIKDPRQIAYAIEHTMLSWHFLGILTEGGHEISTLAELLENASMIIVGAYDGESALIWERTS
jgi:hypothetical protein